MKACPSDDVLADFIENRLVGAILADFYEHTSKCEQCTETLAALARSPSREMEPSSGPSDTSSPAGNSGVENNDWTDRPEIGERYRTLDAIGAGGMGIVYLARDTQLNRNVALKVTRAGISKLGVLRMFREARAMAQLSHRNVVTVHDVGVWNDRVFIAMEHIEGGTLARYLLEQPRSWREILDKFIQAGHGLSAAHRAGIVHRDFKPENVLLSATHEARVADFGLARWSSDGEMPSNVESIDHAMNSMPDDIRRERLTRVGTRVGTLAYMPPEQIQGGIADQRADIWSFCASLYEALYCELPFPGRTPNEVLRYVEVGSVRAPPLGSDVPRWLRAALIRGLQYVSTDRYGTMEALLLALVGGRNQWPGRNKLVVAAAAVAITSLVIVAQSFHSKGMRTAITPIIENGSDVASATQAMRPLPTDASEEPRHASGVERPMSMGNGHSEIQPQPSNAPTPTVGLRQVVLMRKNRPLLRVKLDESPLAVPASAPSDPLPPAVATTLAREGAQGAPIIHD